jgi:hypothetical protein
MPPRVHHFHDDGLFHEVKPLTHAVDVVGEIAHLPVVGLEVALTFGRVGVDEVVIGEDGLGHTLTLNPPCPRTV